MKLRAGPRALLALVALAASGAAIGASLATFSASVANQSTLGTETTFHPISLTAPTIAGTVALNQTLSLQAQGTWRSNVSITRSYQWQVCTSLLTSTCTDIAGATGTSYLITAGSFFRVVETATNAYGPTSAVSSVLS